MRIGFDAKRAAQNATGLGNYSRFVIRILNNFFPDDEQVLYVPNPKKTQHLDKATANGNDNDINGKNVTKIRFPQRIWKRLRSLWRVQSVQRSSVLIRRWHSLATLHWVPVPVRM